MSLVFIRAAVSMAFLLPILLRHGVMALNTQRPGAHLLRGSLLVMANMTFYTGLASLPLAQASAVVFFAPVIITVFSSYFLGEAFGPFRWLAVLVSLTGMMLLFSLLVLRSSSPIFGRSLPPFATPPLPP